jgi:site-specific DNA recombinase
LAVRRKRCGIAAADRHAVGLRFRLDAQHADIERRLEGALRAIENGAWSDSLRQRLSELEARKAALQEQREAMNKPVPTIRLHSNAAYIYVATVADLEASLSAPEIRAEASDAVRALIERVVLTPDADALDRLRAELYGDLARSCGSVRPSGRRVGV